MIQSIFNTFTQIGEYILSIFEPLPDNIYELMYKYHINTKFEIINMISDNDISNENNEVSYLTEDLNKVVEFNSLFAVPQVSNENDEETNLRIINNGIALIREEISELKEAIDTNDVVELKDALCDINYVIYGLMWRLKMFDSKRLINSLINVNKLSFDIDNNYTNVYNIINDTKEKFLSKFDNLDFENDNNIEIIKKINGYKEANELFENICDCIETFGYNESNETIIYYKLIELLNTIYVISNVIFDMREAFDIVHRSNMSKICSNEEEAIETVRNYQAKFETGEAKYDSPYYEKLTDTQWIVRNKSTNKVLKNINYKAVEQYEGWL